MFKDFEDKYFEFIVLFNRFRVFEADSVFQIIYIYFLFFIFLNEKKTFSLF
jgi:hypothetical protein